MFIGFGLFGLLIYPLMLISNSPLLGGDLRPALAAETKRKSKTRVRRKLR